MVMIFDLGSFQMTLKTQMKHNGIHMGKNVQHGAIEDENHICVTPGTHFTNMD